MIKFKREFINLDIIEGNNETVGTVNIITNDLLYILAACLRFTLVPLQHLYHQDGKYISS